MDRRELRQHEALKQEVQFLRDESRFLRLGRDQYRKDWYVASCRIRVLEERVAKLEAENRQLRGRGKELTPAASSPPGPAPASTPPLVKPSGRGRRKPPGRQAGHPPAL